MATVKIVISDEDWRGVSVELNFDPSGEFEPEDVPATHHAAQIAMEAIHETLSKNDHVFGHIEKMEH